MIAEKTIASEKYMVGTSGYSFGDWVGTFYPPGTKSADMFGLYVRHFQTVEVNYTFYRMPSARTLESLARRSPEGFVFWIKANRQITHEGKRELSGEFMDNLAPLAAAGKLAGVLLQFPQSFHRTIDNRKYLSAAVEGLSAAPLAVEFRHASWDHPSTCAGLRERNVAMVVPDCPNISGLFRPAPAVTGRCGYLRLHSRDASKWYAGAAERYDYSYSQQELWDILAGWRELQDQADRVYAFFNNCHRGQAAQNAEAFRRILGQIA